MLGAWPQCNRISELIASMGLPAPVLGEMNATAADKIVVALEFAIKRITLLEWQIRDLCYEPREGIEIPE